MKRPFKIKEVKSGIFLFEFNKSDQGWKDMCMYFLRYQEYYESTSPKFRGKKFTLDAFKKWYSKKYGNGDFTYTQDWAGFNIPGHIIKEVHDLGIDDPNKYDSEMWKAWNECNEKSVADNRAKFYIIGTIKGSHALNHEVAHGYFYLYPEYKKEMTKLVKALPAHIRKEFNTVLKNLGYTPKVYVDETQAYMSTDVNSSFGIDCKEECKPLVKVFKKFWKEH
jgi:hypothetical protein